MDNFEKRIKYLDYMEYGIKIKNGGFLRTEKSEHSCKVQMSVRGLYPTDTLSVDIHLLGDGGKRKVDTMLLHYGKGDYSAVWNAKDLAGSGMSYDKWNGVTISVSEHRELTSVWQMISEPEEILESEAEREKVEVIKEVCKEETVQELHISTGEINVENQDKAVEAEHVAREPEEKTERQPLPFEDLYEDKWTQLEQYYKRIRPFGDGRNYLSITPRDFIVLAGKYQKLVSNSFLLHGYYNYGHVVLGREKKADGYQYYLGVPGIYHEREKQVAMMFGFNGFEGAASHSCEGGFGYYMTVVEI